MQISAEPKGWSDAEVDAIIASNQAISESVLELNLQMDLLTVFILSVGVFVIALFAWHASGLFFPNTRQFIGDE